MKSFDYPLLQLNEFEQVKVCLSEHKSCQVTGCGESQLAHFINGLSNGYKQKVIVTFSATKASQLYQDLKGFADDVVMYPAKDFIFFSADVHGNLILQQRLEFIQKIVEDKPFTVILTPDAFMDKIMPIEKIKNNYLEIAEGSIIQMDALKSKLVQMGYEPVVQIDGPGQFAVRGSIVDIYTLTDEVPYRIDFWDDEVDIIKSFEVESQRSIENLESVKIYPASEYSLTKKEIQAGMAKIRQDLDQNVEKFRKDFKTEEANRLRVTVEEFLTNMDINPSQVAVDSYVNYFYDNLVSLLDYFENPIFFIDEPKRVTEQLNVVDAEFGDSMANRLQKGYVLPGQTDVIWDKNQIIAKIDSGEKVLFTAIAQKIQGFSVDDFVEVGSRNVSPYNGKFEILVQDLKKYKEQKYAVLLVTGSKTRGQRLAEDLREFEISAFFEEDGERQVMPGEVMIIKGQLRSGFMYPMIKFVAISDTDIFGKKKKRKRRKHGYSGTNISSFTDLNIGDYVVHENHGLGVYRGIEKIEVDHIVKDYIKIEYAKGSNLYVLATQLDMIQKYADSTAKPPKLNTLGGQEWKKTKTRVKKAVADIAKELVQLYAIRENSNGYQFSPDTEWQKEFEEMFPFEETDDQLNAISEVKKDMESTKIMDRLICGDVGFGKTEVAIRAAFKAVQDDKQVAYLVPTTVLAQQHYKTFKQRFKDFPVRVEMLSRFRTKSNIDKTIKDLNKGYVDVVIGTHRMLSKDVKFKDLGLLIIDEEQRFGVKHKEQIKELKNNVDVMTLTATPIPRTLAIILYGDLDISIIDEMPSDRLAIKNCVVDDSYRPKAYAFIKKQVSEGRQCYVICPMVEDSENIEAENVIDYTDKLRAELKGVRIEYLHGKMRPVDKNEIMERFASGMIDVLVSTTVIEVGVNVPNSTVMMVENAERFGLAQLHQLRGRVGRGKYQSYCIFVTGNKSKKIKDRLDILQYSNDGFKIAEEDLKQRGPGDFFGVRQSGDFDFGIADVFTDAKTLKEASDAAKEMMDSGFDIEDGANTYLKEKVDDYTRKCLEKINL